MKILGLNGSFRKNGNTEILMKQALMGAESEGASVEIPAYRLQNPALPGMRALLV